PRVLRLDPARTALRHANNARQALAVKATAGQIRRATRDGRQSGGGRRRLGQFSGQGGTRPRKRPRRGGAGRTTPKGSGSSWPPYRRERGKRRTDNPGM